MYTVIELTQRSQVLPFLKRDRFYTAYAIGDLEPGMYEQCKWVGAQTNDGLHALAMLYKGLTPPALFLEGDEDGLVSILEENHFPDQVYLTCRPSCLEMTRDFYAWRKEAPMWRMVLPRTHFYHVPAGCISLTPSHADQLTQLFSLGGGLAFSPEQITHGVFYGIFLDSQIVAVAGTHLVSPSYSVAAIGNVFVHPDCRGHGYGTAVTRAVADELLRRGIQDVVLNVSRDNTPAIHIYEKLGFKRYCLFYEVSATRLGYAL